MSAAIEAAAKAVDKLPVLGLVTRQDAREVAIAALSAALLHLTEGLAEVIESEIDKLRHETRLYPDIYKDRVADAINEELKRRIES